MLEPQYLPDPQPPQDSPRRQRQERTVYTQEQLRELDTEFEKNRYPDYDERKALADRLCLQDHQVQVWFKNRRAKHARQQRQQRLQGQPQQQRLRGRGAQGPPTKCSRVPIPVGSTFPSSSGFCSPGSPSPLTVVPAAEPVGCSLSQAFWAPAQGTQPGSPAARDPPCAQGFSLGPASCPDFIEIFSYQVPFGSPSLIHTISEYQVPSGR